MSNISILIRFPRKETFVVSLFQKRIEKKTTKKNKKKTKTEKEVPQPAIMMPLRMEYSNRSAKQMIFQKC